MSRVDESTDPELDRLLDEEVEIDREAAVEREHAETAESPTLDDPEMVDAIEFHVRRAWPDMTEPQAAAAVAYLVTSMAIACEFVERVLVGGLP